MLPVSEWDTVECVGELETREWGAEVEVTGKRRDN